MSTDDPFVIVVSPLARPRKFSEKTFGAGTRLYGVLDHLSKEIEEVREAQTDPEEWADMAILVFDGVWRNGIPWQVFLDAIRDKQAVNEKRRWPDWRTADTEKAITHVKEVVL